MIILSKLFTKVFRNRALFNKRSVFKANVKIITNVLLICIIGFAEVLSATIHEDSGLFIKQVFLFVVASTIFFSIIPIISLKFIVRYSYLFFGISMVLLLMIFVVGDVSMGARRWVNIFGFRLQPSEVIKTFLTLAIARYLHFTKIDDVGRLSTYYAVFGIIAIPAGLIALQPDLGTAIIIVLIGFGMVFISGIKYAYVIIVAVVGLMSLPLAWINMHDYQQQRVRVFLDPSLDPAGSGYNITQSKIAIGSAGFFGNGYMDGKQSQLNFLPEKHTDFIFTHFCEEFGFIGAIGLIILYSMLFFNMYAICRDAESHFVRVATAGIMLNIFSHVFINIGMTTGLLPVVGIPLPFMSYGGTFLLSNLINIALVLNFSININTVIPTSSKLLTKRGR